MNQMREERGVALIAALLVMSLMSAMLAGMLAMVNADQAAGGIERDQTQAYAAAHAGVEKITADLGELFAGNFSPTGAQLTALADADREPTLPGISYARPDGSSGYRITFRDDNGDGNPDIDDPNGTPITAGPYQGMVGIITPYEVEVTSRTRGNAEVRMRRTMQTIAIPVFQFGLFSENNLSFFAGPDFSFGGKVHTNQHLFLKQDGTATLTLQDRVTAVGEVIRTHLSNGVTGTHNGNVRVARAPGCPAAPASANANCFALGASEGSLVGNLGSAENKPTWANVSVGTSNGWLKNGRTGARRLDLPIVSDGATPIDLVRRPPPGEVATSAIGRQRFYNMATLRILLSDQAADLIGGPNAPPGTVGTPVHLAGSFTPPLAITGSALPVALTAQQFAETPAAGSSGTNNTTRDLGYRNYAMPTIGGYILVNRQDRDGNWTDVTQEILSLGFTGKRLSTGALDTPNFDNNCGDPHPNAIIRLQRVADGVANASGCLATYGLLQAAQLVTLNLSRQNFWPNVLYDPREGALRDDVTNFRPTSPAAFTGVANGQSRVYWGGVIHYVELDVNNLRRWLNGTIGSNGAGCVNGAGGTGCPMDVTGFVVYFSDRRGNRNLGTNGAAEVNFNTGTGFTYNDDRETGEFGFEDNINPGTATSVPNNTLDGSFVDARGQTRFAEDVNARDDQPGNPYVPVLDTYGGVARILPFGTAAGNQICVSTTSAPGCATAAANRTPNNNTYDLYTTPVDRNVARVNRAYFFRRGLKLVNGGRGNLPSNGTQGLTVASENPVYVQGNFNACTNAAPNSGNSMAPGCTGGVGFGNTPGTDHVSAAVIADSVTFLSNAWNDIRSFRNPHDATTGGVTDANSRQASATWYRLAIIGGKGLSFQRPTSNTGQDHTDFGTDGGAHNFIRYAENWGSTALNYRGSLISFYTSRQAVGTYKCCDIVYGAPSRGYNFDTEFLTPSLLPPRTPMFRDINTLTFRQVLRPTQ